MSELLGDPASFRDYLASVLARTRVSRHALSLAMTDGRDQAYVARLLAGKTVGVPNLDRLRAAATLLGEATSLSALAAAAWPEAMATIRAELSAGDAAPPADLDDDDRRRLEEYADFLRWRKGRGERASTP